MFVQSLYNFAKYLLRLYVGWILCCMNPTFELPISSFLSIILSYLTYSGNAIMPVLLRTS